MSLQTKQIIHINTSEFPLARTVFHLAEVIREHRNAGATVVYKILRKVIKITAEYQDKIVITCLPKSNRFPIIDSYNLFPFTYPPLTAAFLRLDGIEFHRKFYQKYRSLREFESIDLTTIQPEV